LKWTDLPPDTGGCGLWEENMEKAGPRFFATDTQKQEKIQKAGWEMCRPFKQRRQHERGDEKKRWKISQDQPN
jgi:hypothetical protein